MVGPPGRTLPGTLITPIGKIVPSFLGGDKQVEYSLVPLLIMLLLGEV